MPSSKTAGAFLFGGWWQNAMVKNPLAPAPVPEPQASYPPLVQFMAVAGVRLEKQEIASLARCDIKALRPSAVGPELKTGLEAGYLETDSRGRDYRCAARHRHGAFLQAARDGHFIRWSGALLKHLTHDNTSMHGYSQQLSFDEAVAIIRIALCGDARGALAKPVLQRYPFIDRPDIVWRAFADPFDASMLALVALHIGNALHDYMMRAPGDVPARKSQVFNS